MSTSEQTVMEDENGNVYEIGDKVLHEGDDDPMQDPGQVVRLYESSDDGRAWGMVRWPDGNGGTFDNPFPLAELHPAH